MAHTVQRHICAGSCAAQRTTRARPTPGKTNFHENRKLPSYPSKRTNIEIENGIADPDSTSAPGQGFLAAGFSLREGDSGGRLLVPLSEPGRYGRLRPPPTELPTSRAPRSPAPQPDSECRKIRHHVGFPHLFRPILRPRLALAVYIAYPPPTAPDPSM